MRASHAAVVAFLSMLAFPLAGVGLLLGLLSLPHYGFLSLASLASFAISLVLAFRGSGTRVDPARSNLHKRDGAQPNARATLVLHTFLLTL